MDKVYAVCRYVVIAAAFALHGLLIGGMIWLFVALSTSHEDAPGAGLGFPVAILVSFPSLFGMWRVYRRLRKTECPRSAALAWGSASALLTPVCDVLLLFVLAAGFRLIEPGGGGDTVWIFCLVVIQPIGMVLLGVKFWPDLIMYFRRTWLNRRTAQRAAE